MKYIVVFLVLVHLAFSAEDCASFKECSTCLSKRDCSWCGGSQTCYDDTVPPGERYKCPRCDVSKLNQCPSHKCSDLTTCATCASAGCLWCGSEKKCQEKDGSYSPSGCEFDCKVCSKTKVDLCPSVRDCAPFKDCQTCTKFGCSWCGSSQTCHEAESESSTTFCDGETCENRECIRSKRSSNCPLDSCMDQKDCYNCTARKCGWCGLTKKCTEVTSGYRPSSCNEPCTKCWKFKTESCALVSECSEMKDCWGCTTRGCEWCAQTQSCHEKESTNHRSAILPAKIRPNDDQMCDGDFCANDCRKTDKDTCPRAPSCSKFTDCYSCTNAKCGWCGSQKKCIELNTGWGQKRGCNEDCPSCLKTQQNECPTVPDCSIFKDCGSCTSKNCGWCSYDQTCHEGDNQGPCDGSACYSCWKTGSSSCPPPSGGCEKFQNCPECTSQYGCGFCAASRTCVEVDGYGKQCTGFCSDMKRADCGCQARGDCTNCIQQRDPVLGSCGYCNRTQPSFPLCMLGSKGGPQREACAGTWLWDSC